ncbi:MAG TPA: DUF3311 domain-containing protein [Streptosporangiaceae bacterium]|jgi:hypothetical protein|nr:DUF3311 domain-containing protein [Streptosporangiaceae bacterium]
MLKSAAVGFTPYVVMLAGVPFVNSTANVGGIPLLGLWILIWVVLTPVFLLAAHRLLPRAEREDGSQ